MDTSASSQQLLLAAGSLNSTKRFCFLLNNAGMLLFLLKTAVYLAWYYYHLFGHLCTLLASSIFGNSWQLVN